MTGDASKLLPGRHVLIRSDVLASATTCNWTVANPPRRTVVLSVEDGQLVATVSKLGMLLIVK